MEEIMSALFETTRIGTMELANRFVRSATNMSMATAKGAPTPDLNHEIKRLSAGGVGLIITGFAYVTKSSQVVPQTLGCYSSDLIPEFATMTDSAHSAGSKIAMQIVHGGVFSSIGNPGLTGEPAIGPSPLETGQGALGQMATIEEIRGIITAFGDAADRAKKSGFDAVQVHGAHGFLLSQFLSPFFNKRTDRYGGSLENRSRIVVEVIESVRSAVGEDFPVLVKINASDCLDGGFSTDEMVSLGPKLEAAGADAIEVSGGTAFGVIVGDYEITFSPTQKGGVYWRDAAKALRNRTSIPVMLVGGIRSFEDAEELVDSNVTDYISFSRPLIREPDLIARWERGDRKEALCVSDNGCMQPVEGRTRLECIHVA
jgi:2,4-dienoyl-CoA reductase-like NADH-dependent reductase (Old Yellow Enzyme family)